MMTRWAPATMPRTWPVPAIVRGDAASGAAIRIGGTGAAARFRLPAARGLLLAPALVAVDLLALLGLWRYGGAAAAAWRPGAAFAAIAVLEILFVVLLRMRVAAAARAGARAERARMLRLLHDTVLQSLEAMALSSSADPADPESPLARLRSHARAEAVRLRGLLAAPDPDPRTARVLRRPGGALRRPGGASRRLAPAATGLAEEMGAVAAELTERGLRVRLVAARSGTPILTRSRRDALCGATRAALGNVLRHSGVREAVVRVEPAGRGVRVVVRDHGRGFDGGAAAYGFGIRESILSRVAEVGGVAEVHAAAGTGTRINLWVPA